MRFLELKIPPPAVAAIAAVAMWLLARALPALDLAIPAREPAAILAALIGIVADLAGLVEFRRARTTINPLKPHTATALVAGGIYQFTRNPMYLGLAFILLGWSIHLSNPACLAVLAAFIGYLDRFQIAPEERILASRFGDAFAAYRARVRRWL